MLKILFNDLFAFRVSIWTDKPEQLWYLAYLHIHFREHIKYCVQKPWTVYHIFVLRRRPRICSIYCHSLFCLKRVNRTGGKIWLSILYKSFFFSALLLLFFFFFFHSPFCFWALAVHIPIKSNKECPFPCNSLLEIRRKKTKVNLSRSDFSGHTGMMPKRVIQSCKSHQCFKLSSNSDEVGTQWESSNGACWSVLYMNGDQITISWQITRVWMG